MIAIDSTMNELEMNLSVEIAPFWKTQAFFLFQDGMKQQQGQSSYGGDRFQFDSFKKILLQTSPYLLLFTFNSPYHSRISCI